MLPQPEDIGLAPIMSLGTYKVPKTLVYGSWRTMSQSWYVDAGYMSHLHNAKILD